MRIGETSTLVAEHRYGFKMITDYDRKLLAHMFRVLRTSIVLQLRQCGGLANLRQTTILTGRAHEGEVEKGYNHNEGVKDA